MKTAHTEFETMHAQFVGHVKDFIQTENISASRLGKESVNDDKIVLRVLRGGNCTLSTADRILAFIRSRKKQGAQ